MILSSSDPLKYYRNDLNFFSINELIKTKEEKIIIIPYTSEIWGINYEEILTQGKYQFTKKVNFRGVYYEIYKKIKKN